KPDPKAAGTNRTTRRQMSETNWREYYREKGTQCTLCGEPIADHLDPQPSMRLPGWEDIPYVKGYETIRVLLPPTVREFTGEVQPVKNDEIIARCPRPPKGK